MLFATTSPFNKTIQLYNIYYNSNGSASRQFNDPMSNNRSTLLGTLSLGKFGVEPIKSFNIVVGTLLKVG